MSFQQNIYDVLESTGLAIISSFWQTGFFVLVYLLVALLINIKASIKYLILVCLQIISFFLFIYTFISGLYINQHTSGFLINNELIDQIQNNSILHSFLFTIRFYTYLLLPYLSVTYFLVLAFLTTKYFYQFLIIQDYCDETKLFDSVAWYHFIHKSSLRFKIKQKILLVWSDKISGPFTIGFLKPIILIPLANFNHLSEEQMEAVLLHELAHIKRYDYLINLCMKLIESFLFFNPFTHYLNKQISKERENSCDDLVLENHYNPFIYADALLKLAFLSAGRESSYLMHAAKKENVLLTRINRIIGLKDKPAITAFSFIRLLSPLMLFSISLMINSVSPISKSNSNRKTLKEIRKIVYLPSSAINLPTKTANPRFVNSYKRTNTVLKGPKILTPPKIAIQDSTIASDIALNEIVDALKEFKNIQTQKINITKENKSEKLVSVTLYNSDDELKQRLKTYLSKNNSSIHEIKNKLDSINLAEAKYLLNYSSKGKDHLFSSVNSLFIPALYFEKKNELQKTDSLIHTNPVNYNQTNADGHIYIIINLKNINGSNDQLMIELTSKEIE